MALLLIDSKCDLYIVAERWTKSLDIVNLDGYRCKLVENNIALDVCAFIGNHFSYLEIIEIDWKYKLPTYSILFERNTNLIESVICPRCEKEEKYWNHIWIHEDNKVIPLEVESAIVKMVEIYEATNQMDMVVKPIRCINI
ncbi:hypothetical protein RhiirA5_439101 [Rhizophagus irregularis]|uniref:Uncharacterized protein n=1 Tax=Rhizophagus irregularis TaxID=588596 RepID=A0A2N0NIA2_9GLOM|nr:hypothetical protein RhiirA5_439101 [Rhizophagus irregularis]PKC66768.1 hypothetical protein RhiirA1_459282 [Rhizophagus irregularis]GET61956.1 hypothetical protein GLOIN_2v1873035 [Rhizophagus irregularis DAOM 181602=DAOM 197198]